MDEIDILIELGRLAENGYVREFYDPKDGELKYNITEKGVKFVIEEAKRNKRFRITLFASLYNLHKNFSEEPYKSLVVVVNYFKNRLGIKTIAKDIVEAVEKGWITGIEIKDKDGFIKLFA